MKYNFQSHPIFNDKKKEIEIHNLLTSEGGNGRNNKIVILIG